MGVGAVAGTKLYIADPGPLSPTPTYVEIGEIASLGDIALQFSAITVESVGSGDSYTVKGTRNLPNFELTLNRDDEDAGQIELKAAAEAARGTLYNFKILEVDGGIATWEGEVYGYGPVYGGVNSLKAVRTSISIIPSSLILTLSA